MKWYIDVLKRSLQFTGTTDRKQFWLYTLVSFGFLFLINYLESLIGIKSYISTTVGIGLLFPTIAIASRRLRDAGQNTWWLLIVVVPFAGWLILYYLCSQKSERQKMVLMIFN